MAARPNARGRRAAKPYPLARPNAQERAGDVGKLFWTDVLRSCRPIHVTGHSTINLRLHLHTGIGFSNVSDIHYAHPLNTACIEIQCVTFN